MKVGKVVKPEKAEAAIAKMVGEFIEGESVLYVAGCGNLRPPMQAILVTNARILGISIYVPVPIAFAAPLSSITSTFDEKHRKIKVVSDTGATMTFKGVTPEDIQAVAHHIELARSAPVPDVLAAGLAALPVPGREVGFWNFGGKVVHLYEGGFVRIGGGFGLFYAPYERLIVIEATSDVSKKSGIGRGVTAAVTLGANLYTSNKRGDVYLTITTDATTHVLHEEPPTASNLRRAKGLEAAGIALIKAASAAQVDSDKVPGSPASKVPPSLSDRLSELTLLLDQGLVSTEEYDALRAKILNSI